MHTDVLGTKRCCGVGRSLQARECINESEVWGLCVVLCAFSQTGKPALFRSCVRAGEARLRDIDYASLRWPTDSLIFLIIIRL